MRSLSFFIIFLSLLSSQSNAQQHAISPVLSYNLSQAKTPAYGIFYQYNFYESIELELGLLQKNSIELNENNVIRSGQYDSAFIGTNFIRQYSKNTQLKMGGGVSYISKSDNEQLIEEKSYSPYVKFAANMSFSKNISVELGQMTQFIIGDVELSHNVFLGFTWKFGHEEMKRAAIDKSKDIIVPAINKNTSKAALVLPTQTPIDNPLSINSKSVIADVADSLVESKTQQSIPHSIPDWAIQLGAFQENIRAVKQKAIMTTQLINSDENMLRIINHKGLYKILSPSFKSRQQALDWLKEAKYSYQWNGFPVFFPQ